MKKALLLAATLLVSTFAFAKNYVFVSAGDVSVLKNGANKAFVQVDYTKAMVEGINYFDWMKRRGDEWIRDWPKDEQEIREFFVKYFNKKNKKGMKAVSTPELATHKMIITPTQMDMGNTGGAFVPGFNPKSGGAVLWGYIETIDNQTGATVLTLGIDEVRGNSNWSESGRLKLAFYDLAGEVAGVK